MVLERRLINTLCWMAVAAPALGAAAQAGEPAAPVDFMRDIRPILSQNCFMCHGPDEGSRQSGLRLDQREGIFAELDRGGKAVAPGKPEESRLFARLTHENASRRMPPPETGRTLTAEQVELIRRWIEQGAAYDEHWSFQPLERSTVPGVRDSGWPRNGIDHFVLARLEQEGIEPSPEADRATLIRRLSLDLLGLPPTPAEVEEFVNDRRPGAYERLVDRLLSSPHFGERWGRHWLDLARYADSDGYLGDNLRPYAWLYRDWVIQAINSDLPFDRFTIEQLAGDLLPDATLEQRVATGFHRNSLKNTEAGADREADRVQRTVDRVSTTGTVWLGLTVGCAECHSHKFDPISHREFYQFYAFFNTSEERDLPAPTPEELAEYEQAHKNWTRKMSRLEREIEAAMAEEDGAEEDGAKEDGAEEDGAEEDAATTGNSSRSVDIAETILPILAAPDNKRKEAEKEWLETFLAEVDPEQRRLLEKYETTAAAKPSAPSTKAPTMAEGSRPRSTYIHLRGDFRSQGETVEPGTPAALPPLEARGDRPDRLDLARWLVDPANPLTARTTVNHFWKHLFGRGLVHTVDDFGATGEMPSHPELLDWLAVEFLDRAWSRKAVIRLIVTSSTYRQASHARPELTERDPFNTLLARQGRFRLEAEVVRDLALSVSGLLHATIGGPSIRPPLHSQVTAISRNKDWKVSPGAEKHRRGMYILFRRATPYPMLTTFDAPDTTVACAQRERSNSPLQALTLLNDPVFFECAQHLGRRLMQDEGTAPEIWIHRAFRLCLAREPAPAELERAVRLYDEQRELISRAGPTEWSELAGRPLPGADVQEQAARVAVARILMNLDEFITRE